MKSTSTLCVALFALSLGAYGQNQSAATPPQTTAQAPAPRTGRSPGGDIGSGSGDIGKGVGRGAGSLAKGTGKGAVDLVTLHPINAAGDIGKGGVSAGKNIAVGTTKGTGKILKGTGRGIRKLF